MATTPAPNPDAAGKPKFVSEPIFPEPGSGATDAMARGEPGLPRAFQWRKQRYEVAAVESTWKGHGEDRGDVYVRRHWYDIVTVCGRHMRIYFDRNPGRTGSRRSRWWVYWIR